MCGNGVIDVAAGERDCGADGALGAGCRMANSDDPDAECSARCELRRCGDGELGGIEECDVASDGSLMLREPLACASFGFYQGQIGCSSLCRLELSSCHGRCGDGVVDGIAGEACDGDAFAAGASCGDLGYYEGEVACSAACQLTATASTCTGQCGDGIVDADAGELCDGASQTTMCADVGYDAGLAACGAGCGFELSTCERFGWEHPVQVADVRQLWANGDLFAYVDYISESWTAFVRDGDRTVAAPTSTYRLDGEGDTIFAVHAYDNSFARYTRGGAAFESMPARPVGHVGGYVLALGADEALATAGFTGGPNLWRFSGGAWAPEATFAATVTLTGMGKDADYLYALGYDSGPGRAVVFRRARTGGTWTRFQLPASGVANAIATAADGTVYVGADTQLLVGLENPTSIPGTTSAYLGGAFSAGMVGRFYDYDAGAFKPWYRGSGGFVPLQTPPGGLFANGRELFTTNGGLSSSGIYRARGSFWSAQQVVPEAADTYSDARFVGAQLRAGSAVLWSQNDLFERDGPSIRTVFSNAGVEITSACRTGAYLYASIGYDSTINSGAIWAIAANGTTTKFAVGAGARLTCNPATGEVISVSATAVARGVGLAITVTPVTSPFSWGIFLATNAAGVTYTVNRYGTLYRLEGTTFIHVADLAVGTGGCSLGAESILGCGEDLHVDADGTWIVVAPDRVFRGDGANLTAAELGDAGLRAVFGSAPDDVWAVGGVDGAWGTIWHWDGASWSKVAPPLDEPFHAGAASADEVLLLARDRTISLIRP
ncbi:MAG: hypothetical protein R2939_18660 [Kofleriaceae bacterium]